MDWMGEFLSVRNQMDEEIQEKRKIVFEEI